MSTMLPPALDAQTVSRFLADLDDAVYPTPNAGFTARLAVLAALTSLSMLLSAVYLGFHYYSTLERPRRRSLWLVRFLDRPSGRFLAINTRPSWTVSIFLYSAFQLACLVAYWRGYGRHDSLAAWIVLRAFIGVFLFAAAWLISWSGLMAFLLAVEPEKIYVSARTANLLFVGGGALVFSVNLVIAIATAIYGVRLFNVYLDLRGALLALEASLAGRAPTLLDLLPLKAPFGALASAGNAARITNALTWSVVAVCPLFILVVDLGGLLLCARMRRQIKESVEVLGDGGGPGRAAPAQAVCAAAADESTGEPVQLGARITCLGWRKRRGRARQRGREASTTERAQARKVLVFQKAVTDLQTLASVVAFSSFCVLGITIWAAYSAASPIDESVSWGYTESLATAAFWIYTVPACAALMCLTLNALRSRRRIADLETQAPSSSSARAAADGAERRTGAQLGLACTASDPSSAGASVKSPTQRALVLEVGPEPGSPSEKVPASPVELQQSLPASPQASPASLDRSRTRASLRRMSSFFSSSSWDGAGGAAERDSAGSVRSRPSSAAIVVTVEEVVVTDHEDDERGGAQRGARGGEPGGP
ncbi:hypothetical protein JCM9279_003955 [Rhodotorula babjevae]